VFAAHAYSSNCLRSPATCSFYAVFSTAVVPFKFRTYVPHYCELLGWFDGALRSGKYGAASLDLQARINEADRSTIQCNLLSEAFLVRVDSAYVAEFAPARRLINRSSDFSRSLSIDKTNFPSSRLAVKSELCVGGLPAKSEVRVQMPVWITSGICFSSFAALLHSLALMPYVRPRREIRALPMNDLHDPGVF